MECSRKTDLIHEIASLAEDLAQAPKARATLSQRAQNALVYMNLTTSRGSSKILY